MNPATPPRAEFCGQMPVLSEDAPAGPVKTRQNNIFSHHLSKRRIHGNAAFSGGGEAAPTSRALEGSALRDPPAVMEILRRLRLSPHRIGGGGAGLLRSWHRGARSINVKVLCFIVLIKFGKHTHELSSED